jgi:hypothetical protein
MVCRRRRQPACRRLLSPTGCRGAAAGELFVRRWQGGQLPPYFGCDFLGLRCRSVPSRELDTTLKRSLAAKDAEAELEAGRNRRTDADALFEPMDEGHLDLDLAAIDRINEPSPPTPPASRSSTSTSTSRDSASTLVSDRTGSQTRGTELASSSAWSVSALRSRTHRHRGLGGLADHRWAGSPAATAYARFKAAALL